MIGKILNHKIEIAFLIIGFIATIVALLIYFNKLSDKGFYVKLYGFIISSIAIGLTVFYSEKKSSDTSNEIKTNTFKNLQLTSKVDTTTLETKD